MDKLDLIFRYTNGNQLFANILVHIKVAVIFRCGEVTEQKLCQLLVFAIFPDFQHVLHTDVQLAVGIVRQHGVHQANVQANLAPIVGDAEHIVHGRIDDAGVDICGTFAQFLHHFLLNFGRLCHHGFKLCDRHRQMKLVASFNVRNLLEHGHQFREVEKLGEPGAGTVAGTLRGKLNGRGRLTKGGCPAVEVRQLFLLQGAVLEVPHDRVQLGHGVRHRGAGRKHHATSAGDLIQIAALAEHIAGFLCFTGG